MPHNTCYFYLLVVVDCLHTVVILLLNIVNYSACIHTHEKDVATVLSVSKQVVPLLTSVC